MFLAQPQVHPLPTGREAQEIRKDPRTLFDPRVFFHCKDTAHGFSHFLDGTYNKGIAHAEKAHPFRHARIGPLVIKTLDSLCFDRCQKAKAFGIRIFDDVGAPIGRTLAGEHGPCRSVQRIRESDGTFGEYIFVPIPSRPFNLLGAFEIFPFINLIAKILFFRNAMLDNVPQQGRFHFHRF